MNVFIGELPPPYGGVAVKDKLVYKEVYEPLGVKMLNLVECKWKPYKIPIVGFRMLWWLATAKYIIIGVGTDKRRKIIMAIRKLLRGKKGLNSVIMLAMGGRIQESTKKDDRLKALLIENKTVWVETEGMKKSLEEQGFKNIRVFPNCRTGIGAIPPKTIEEKIKFVFFSRICAEKGVNEIINAVKNISIDYCLDFYGEIAEEYRETFFSFLKDNPDIKYHGVFDSTNGNVYEELNRYDVMLLPTMWVGEGVPGALVESKMAGITAIVSDWNYNSEVVVDGVEGIIIHDNLADIINSLSVSELMEYKVKAFDSRNRYCISTYTMALAGDLV